MATFEPCHRKVLMDALDVLTEFEYDRFKVLLTDRTILWDRKRLKNFPFIRKQELKTENRAAILQTMLDTYGIFTIKVMRIVLKEMLRNQTLDNLFECSYDPEAVVASCQSKLQSLLKSLHKVQVKSNGNVPDTRLFITEGASAQVSEDDEVRQTETDPVQDKSVHCQDIFKEQRGKPIRTVLTRSVRKTALTQKISVDWAEGRAHQDMDLLFPFSFKELNELKYREFSLVELLHHCFRQTEELFSFQCLQLLFIFDGLDECSLPLDFSRTRVLTDPTESASVEELLVNLIRGSLLPSARLWITTRPEAADRIPEECVSMVTEVRGFTESQEEKVIRKRIREEEEATANVFNTKKICSRPEVAVEERLLKVLEQLDDTEEDSDLEIFKFYLKTYSDIPTKDLGKGAKRIKIIRVLMEYKKDEAVSATITILRKMKKNNLADSLSQDTGVQA